MIPAVIVIVVTVLALVGVIVFAVLRKKDSAEKTQAADEADTVEEIGSVTAEALDTGEIIECKLVKVAERAPRNADGGADSRAAEFDAENDCE